MHPLLLKLFAKRGIEDIKQLDPEERQDFENWNKVLSKEELTLEDIKLFCQSQIDVIENKWKDLNLEDKKKMEMIAPHTVYKTILQTINAPKVVREQLEKQLLELTKN